MIRAILILFLSSSLFGSVDVWLKSLPRYEVQPQKEREIAPSIQMIQALRWEKCLKKHSYLKDKLPVLLKILAKEQELERDYYIFYHAASSLSFLYDTLNLYVEKKAGCEFKDFSFMRVPWEREFVEHGMKDIAINTTLAFEKRYTELQAEIDEAFYNLVRYFKEYDWIENVHSTEAKNILYSTFHLYTHEKSFKKPAMRTKCEELRELGVIKTNEDQEHLEKSLDDLYVYLNSESPKNPVALKFIATRNDHLDSSYSLHQKFSDYILSVNLSLFGNVYSGYDCTLEYWKDSKNHIRPNSLSLLRKFCQEVGIDARFVKEGLKLYRDIEAEDSWIYMVCVPKRVWVDDALVNPLTEIGYLSFGGYTPARIYDDVMNTYPYLVDLDQYMEPFSKASTKTVMGHKMQGRLVFNTNYLLNPFSGCKIVKFSMIDDARYAKFKKGLLNLFEKYDNTKEVDFQCTYSQERYSNN